MSSAVGAKAGGGDGGGVVGGGCDIISGRVVGGRASIVVSSKMEATMVGWPGVEVVSTMG